MGDDEPAEGQKRDQMQEQNSNLMILSSLSTQQQQQSDQQQDDQVTNCSETMSTNDEAEAEMFRHNPLLQGQDCDRQQQLTQEADEAETTTLSLASGMQAPPSYGTATRLGLAPVAILDAGNLPHMSAPQQWLTLGASATLESCGTGKFVPQQLNNGAHYHTVSMAPPGTAVAEFSGNAPPVHAGGPAALNPSNLAAADNNRLSMLNQRQPINHVISGRASMQWVPAPPPPQQQQQLATNQIGATNAAGSHSSGVRASMAATTMLNNNLAPNNGPRWPICAPPPDSLRVHQAQAQVTASGAQSIDAAGWCRGALTPIERDALAAAPSTSGSISSRPRRLPSTAPSPAATLRTATLDSKRLTRKRYRHRSVTSANRNELTPDSLAPVGDNGGQQQNKAMLGGSSRQQTPDTVTTATTTTNHKRQGAISAHCWLIDSSDDQTYAQTKAQSRSEHLTVAIERQVQEREHRLRQPHAGYATLASPRLPGGHKIYAQDMTADLKVNSLRMGRALTRRNPASSSVASGSGVGGDAALVRQRSMQSVDSLSGDDEAASDPHERSAGVHQARNRRARAARSSANRRSPVRSMVRLSALLSVVSNLVRRGGSSVSGGVASGRGPHSTAGSHRRSKSCNFQDENRSYQMPARPADRSRVETVETARLSGGAQPRAIILGSASTAGSLCGGQSSSYTAASLASSSTSAYATGSSSVTNRSLVSSDRGSLTLSRSHSIVVQKQQQLQQQQQQSATLARVQGPTIAMQHLRCLQPGKLAPPKAAISTCGSSFYSSAVSSVSTGNFRALPGSAHPYEYCDSIPATTNGEQHKQTAAGLKLLANENEKLQLRQQETQFIAAHTNLNSAQAKSAFSASSSSTGSDFGGGTNSSERSHEAEAVTMNLGATQEYRLAQVIMSDHELISDCQQAGSSEGHSAGVQVPSAARRRWWWNSLKVWFRQPCPTSETRPNDSIEAVRYRSMRVTGKRKRQLAAVQDDNSAGGGGGSTLQNVISLAKVDRVFRVRLLASVLVSCLLLLLICLLVSLIYSRSINLYGQGGKFSLLIDDSDYDLSWLWSNNNDSQQQTFPSQAKSKLSHPEVPPPPPDGQPLPRVNQFQTQLDQSIRSHLMLIERSERLNQFQQTVAHLTNIQLANDNYLDLAKLASRLQASEAPDDESQGPPNQTTRGPRLIELTNGRPLSESNHDLVSLTLLSNLHWPLVKWRHQSQQSIADFLSLAMSPISNHFDRVGPSYRRHHTNGTRQPSAQVGIRNLLSLLILAETAPELLTNVPGQNPSSYDLQQFVRLNALIRDTSQYIIECSTMLNSAPVQPHSQGPNLRRNFCHLLLRRYRQMMVSLSQLNHNHLAEIYNAMELSLVDTVQQQQRHSRSSSKTLLGFFMDRLALLEARTIAELTLMQLDEFVESTGEWSRLIDYILSPELGGMGTLPIDANGRSANDNKWNREPLIEHARLIVGEDPVRLNVELDHELKDAYALRLNQIKTESQWAWRQEIANYLLYPWSSDHLPQFVTPISYDLFLHPNLTTRLVQGMAKIEFQLEQPTRFIVINSDQLNLVELTLWQRQAAIEPFAHTIRSPQEQEPKKLQQANLRQIQIRRVIRNPELQQIYIELHEPIDVWRGSAGDISSVRLGSSGFAASSRTSGRFTDNEDSLRHVDFGELPGILGNGGGNSEPVPNRFVISLSYNKTNLMPLSATQASHERDPPASAGDDTGLEFVQYADYFAQPEAELKNLLFSKFERSNARKLFPCFDEPQFKAKFQLSLVHDQNHQVLFSSPKRERLNYSSDGCQMSVFEETPVPISTHLVAFVVCDVQNIKSITSRLVQFSPIRSSGGQTKTDKHIQVQILSQFEYLSHAEFASQLVPRLLAFYQEYLLQAYPMEKLDLIAVPKSQFAPLEGYTNANEADTLLNSNSAQDNFGLLLFRSSLLQLDVNLISQDLIEQISLVISRQLARQFFSNLVTIRRWHDQWLYEALCQYFESLALAQVQADWRLDEQFPVASIRAALAFEHLADLMADVSSQSQPPARLLNQESEEQIDGAPQPAAMPSVAAGGEDNLSAVADQTNNPIEATATQDEDLFGPLGEQTIGFNSKTADHPFDLSGKSAAVLHMLMLNLLPNSESQARLFRRCLSTFRLKTMSSAQFWRQFGDQLALEASTERLALDVTRLLSAHNLAPKYHHNSDSTIEPTIVNASANIETGAAQEASERVVYVRPAPKISTQRSTAREDLAEMQWRTERPSNRLVDNLDLVARFWAQKRGFPLINAHSYRDRVQLKQERFTFAWSSEAPDSNDDPLATNQTSDLVIDNQEDTVWPIPIMFVSRLNPKWPKFFWMDRREVEFSLASSVPLTDSQRQDQTMSGRSRVSILNPWFKLNVNQTSLARVNYDERNWEALTDLLSKSHYSNHLLNPLDRANLLDDALTLMRCGKLSPGIAMNLTLYLEVGEREFQPWSVVLTHLAQMQTLMNQNPLWHRYVLKLLQPISSVIGWKDDGPHLMRKLRRDLFAVSLQFGDEKTINKAKQEFKSWSKSNRFIVPNLQELVYVAGVRHGDQEDWSHCWRKYQQLVSLDVIPSANVDYSTDYSNRNSKTMTDRGGRIGSQLTSGASQPAIAIDPDVNSGPNAENEKLQLLTALASTQNTWLLEQFLNYTLDVAKIQPHHLRHVVQTLGNNPVARLYLWRFVRLNWNTLVENCDFPLTTSGEQAGNDQLRLLNQHGPQPNHILEIMILESTKHFATKLDFEEVKVFFDLKLKQLQSKTKQSRSPGKRVKSSLERTMRQSLQVIRSNIYWRNHIEPKLTRWLTQHDSNTIT